MKTEYRLIPLRTYSGDMYLQFKSTKKKRNIFGKKKTVEVWRFVPKDSVASFLGLYLSEDKCPTSLPLFCEDRFLSCFKSYDLLNFIMKYDNIDNYFKHISEKRSEYLKQEEEKRNLRISILTTINKQP